MEDLQARPFSFREIRTVPEVINAAFDFVRLNFRVLARGILLYIAPLMLVCHFLLEYTLSDSRMLALMETLSDGAVMSRSAPFDVAESALVMFLALLLLFASFALLIAYTFGAVRVYMRGDGSVLQLEDVWRETKAMFWKVVGTNTLLSLVIGGCMAVFAVVVAFLFMVFYGLGLLAYVGVLVLWVFLVTRYSLFYPVCFLENKKLGAAFEQSRELVEGRWWQTLGLILFGAMLSYAFNALTTLPALLFSLLLSMGIIPEYALYDPSSMASILQALLSAVFSTAGQVMFLFLLLGITLHFFSQMERQQGLALAAEVERIGMPETSV